MSAGIDRFGFPQAQYLFEPLKEELQSTKDLQSAEFEAYFHTPQELFRYRYAIKQGVPPREIFDSMQLNDDAIAITRQELERRNTIRDRIGVVFSRDFKALQDAPAYEKVERVYKFFVDVSKEAYSAVQAHCVRFKIAYLNSEGGGLQEVNQMYACYRDQFAFE